MKDYYNGDACTQSTSLVPAATFEIKLIYVNCIYKTLFKFRSVFIPICPAHPQTPSIIICNINLGKDSYIIVSKIY